MKNIFTFSLPELAFAFALLAQASTALAHGSHDTGAQLMLLDGSTEAAISIGKDGARHVLHRAGLSAEAANDALAFRGPSTATPLPLHLASNLLELKSGGKVLPPESLKVITDGIESSFILSYPGAISGQFQVRARYLEGDDSLKPGALIVLDEMKNVKATAMLSAAEPMATLDLPKGSHGTPPAPGGANEQSPAAGTGALRASDIEQQQTARPGVPKTGKWISLLPLLVMAAVFLVAFYLRSRRR